MINFNNVTYDPKTTNLYIDGKKMTEIIINGYVYIRDKYGKSYRKNRIVFSICNKIKIDSNMIINHIDGNKLNNNIQNLEMITPKENTKHWYDKINKDDLTKNFLGKEVFLL